MPRSSLLRLATLALAIGAATPAAAEDVHGRIEATKFGAVYDPDSIATALGYPDTFDFMGNARVWWEPRQDAWDFSIHAVLELQAGRGVALANDLAALAPPPPPATWFDLDATLLDDPQARVTTRIDRLSIGYSAPKFVVRAGRQTITWGAGMVFRPMDIVAPFPPGTTDTQFKPGVDMLYSQFLFDSGADLQAIAVPRPAVAGGPVTLDASTIALHYNTSLGDLQATTLLAWDHGDWVGALGLSGALGGAVWNTEVVPVLLSGGSLRTSFLANISGAATVFDRNATWFAEYFHNGFGVASGTPLDALPAALSDRLARGQVFNTGRDFAASGMLLEWTPLTTVAPSLIVNLNDFSIYAAAEIDRSLSDNANLIAGVQLPVGPDGTEFGGPPTDGTLTTFASPPASAYVKARRYF